jgi:hypothetical protein
MPDELHFFYTVHTDTIKPDRIVNCINALFQPVTQPEKLLFGDPAAFENRLLNPAAVLFYDFNGLAPGFVINNIKTKADILYPDQSGICRKRRPAATAACDS